MLFICNLLSFSGYLVSSESSGNDKYGFCMLLTSIFGVCGPFFLTFVSILMDYDKTDFILRILSDPKYWSYETVCITVLIRILVLLMVAVEFCRSGSFFCMCGLLGALQATEIVNVFETLSFPLFAYLYTQLRLIHAKMRVWFEWLLYFTEAIFFWGTIISCWFVIRAGDSMELVIYLVFVLATVTFITVQVLLLPDAVESTVKAETVVISQRIRMKELRSKRKHGTLRYMKIGESIFPIRIMCGSFRKIDKEILL